MHPRVVSMIDRTSRKLFVEIVLNPSSWLERADDLLETAEALEDTVRRQLQAMARGERMVWRGIYSRGPHATYCMLMAFALENILKAALVRRDAVKLRPTIEGTGKLPKSLTTHELYDLVLELDMAIDQSAEIYIRKLATDVIWVGRYPVPLQSRELVVRRFSGGRWASVHSASENEVELLHEIIDSCRKELAI